MQSSIRDQVEKVLVLKRVINKGLVDRVWKKSDNIGFGRNMANALSPSPYNKTNSTFLETVKFSDFSF